MKRDKKILAAVLALVIVTQVYVFSITSSIYSENGFAIGFPEDANNPKIGLYLMYMIAPVLFLLFFTSGSMYEITHGYGKILIIRNYSKTRLLMKKVLKNAGVLLSAVLLQCLVFWPFNHLFLPVKNGMAQSLLLYAIILHAIVLLQYLLELFIPAQTANLILFIYCFASCYAVQIFDVNDWLKIALFPSLMFGMQNGAVNGEAIYGVYLAVGVCLNLLLTALCIRKFKTTDIF